MKICPNCNSNNPDEARFCRHCGNAFPVSDASHTASQKGSTIPQANITEKIVYRYEKNPLNNLLLFLVVFFSICVGGLVVWILSIHRLLPKNEVPGIEHIDTIDIVENVDEFDVVVTKVKPIVDEVKKIIVPNDFVFVDGGILHNKEWNDASERYEIVDYNIDGFYICNHELTQMEYEKVMGGISEKNWEFFLDYGSVVSKGDNIPVAASYIDFVTYCNKKSQEDGYDGFYTIKGDLVSFNPDGNGYRLLFEMEWIYAAKGGKLNESYKYIGGDDLKEVAWYGGNSNGKPHDVCLKKPNGLGIYDMAGNAEEMLETKYKARWHFVAGDSFRTWFNYSLDSLKFTPNAISYYTNNTLFHGTRLALVPPGVKNDNYKIHAKYY